MTLATPSHLLAPLVSPLRTLLLGVLLLALPLACEKSPAPSSPPAAASPAPKRIAIIPKGTTHIFWKSVEAGAQRAATESAGAFTITYRGPEKEDDRDQQISLLQNTISARYDAIVLAPLDRQALLEPVRQAARAGIPIIIMDSALDGKVGEDFVSFIATDGLAGGTLAGNHLASLLPKGGKVLLLRYTEGSASTDAREQGFSQAITAAAKALPALELVDPKRYAGATRASAQDASENLLAAHPDITAIFCPNESTTFGMLLALRARNLAGKVTFIGFDSSPELIAALRAGELEALVVQNPEKMGYLATKAAADALANKPIEPRIDTGVALITRQAIDTPENQAILNPGK